MVEKTSSKFWKAGFSQVGLDYFKKEEAYGSTVSYRYNVLPVFRILFSLFFEFFFLCQSYGRFLIYMKFHFNQVWKPYEECASMLPSQKHEYTEIYAYFYRSFVFSCFHREIPWILRLSWFFLHLLLIPGYRPGSSTSTFVSPYSESW